ncbi:endoplasmic reticulum lectin 1 isoform X2 [Neocloeon triangulifer]|uniref:endoplasmic reticulum lectin 1 isoform X2 n=1 Tax=Neocloeon triangulifer TaxID=2078957 RepID=UPI00286F0D83|nr:endoplasmic reticulum lectin 1 isoform X2 [Neocloeon triangulifer]
MRDRVLKMVENRCRVLFICIIISLWPMSDAFDGKAFDDTILFKINWPGKEGLDAPPLDNHESLVMTTINNEKYNCLLPQTLEGEQDKPEVYAGPTALELMLPLLKQTGGQSPCSYRLESYWTYELCHGKYMRQFHEDREGKKQKLQEYYLGKWDSKYLEKLSKSDFQALEEAQKLSIQVKKIDGMSLPYLQINMSDGTLCDLNKKPRSTRVQYVCYQHGKHEIYSLKETSTCEYEAVVLSPFLCSHPLYRPQETGENQVSCYPLESSPKKPKNLIAMEAESLKLRHQKGIEQSSKSILEKDGQKIIVSISPIDGQDKVRVEIKSFDIPEDSEPGDSADKLQNLQQKAILRRTAISNFLDGKNCLTGGNGWWKYEFCYGQKVEQYHEEKDGRNSIILGIFDLQRHRQWLQENPHKKPKPLGQRKQVSHLYSGGSFCEKVNKPRQVEVKLKCLEDSSSSAISLYLLEPRTCEYLLGVESTVICDLLPYADEDGLLNVPDYGQIKKVAEMMMDKIMGSDGHKIHLLDLEGEEIHGLDEEENKNDDAPRTLNFETEEAKEQKGEEEETAKSVEVKDEL